MCNTYRTAYHKNCFAVTFKKSPPYAPCSYEKGGGQSYNTEKIAWTIQR